MVFDLFTPSRPTRAKLGPEVRRELYRRQQGRCVYCGGRQRMDLMDVDHKTPLARGGSNDRRNLQLLCRTCNVRKGTKTDREFRQAHRDAGVPRTRGAPQRTIRQSSLAAAGKRSESARRRKQRADRNRDPLEGWRWF